MTIADNLTALANQKLGYQDSVEACKTSLTNKDVVVPVGAKLADISGLIDEITVDKSWENYVAVRNRTKTTIEAGDIDCSNLTGAYCAQYLFYGVTTITKAILDLKNVNATGGLAGIFQGCTSLVSIDFDLSNLGGTSVTGALLNAPVSDAIFRGISDSTIWNSTSANQNLFRQLALCVNLTITCDIRPNCDMSLMTSLNLASVVQVLGQLYNYSAGVAHTITFNRSFTGLSLSDYNLINNAKIQANARNWTVAGLTYSM